MINCKDYPGANWQQLHGSTIATSRAKVGSLLAFAIALPYPVVRWCWRKRLETVKRELRNNYPGLQLKGVCSVISAVPAIGIRLICHGMKGSTRGYKRHYRDPCSLFINRLIIHFKVLIHLSSTRWNSWASVVLMVIQIFVTHGFPKLLP